MSGIGYDLDKLKSSDKIDVDSGIKNCGGRMEYYAALTDFAGAAPGYLTKYNAYKIATREEARKWFLDELKRLRELFTRIGLSDAILDLKYLEKAAIGRDSAGLETELGEFYSSMKALSGFIESLQITSPQEAAQLMAGASANEKKLILAVDDMPGLLATTVKMLRDEYNVIAVPSAAHALKVLESQTPDLFLLDIEMPEMTGYELAAIIRAKHQFETTPIIFLTAKSTRDDVITAIQYGGNDYIIKPVDKEMLISKIQRYLQ